MSESPLPSPITDHSQPGATTPAPVSTPAVPIAASGAPGFVPTEGLAIDTARGYVGFWARFMAGAIDAAIVDPVPPGTRCAPVVPDPEATFRTWQHKHRAVTLNHVIVVRESLARDDEAMQELFRLFRESQDIAGDAVDRGSTPIGLEANRRNLEVAIAVADAQGLLARQLTVDDLVTDVVASLQ